MIHHFRYFVHQERKGPRKQIKVIGECEGLLYVLILFYIHLVVLYQNNCALVLVRAAVVGGREHSDHRGERLRSSPSVHFVTIYLNLMCSDYRQEIVFLQYLLYWLQSEFV